MLSDDWRTSVVYSEIQNKLTSIDICRSVNVYELLNNIYYLGINTCVLCKYTVHLIYYPLIYHTLETWFPSASNPSLTQKLMC